PAGMAALGTRALHIQVRVNRPDSMPLVGRLDSCADITLISDEYCRAQVNFPKPRAGMKMRLIHLTGDAMVLGYVQVPIYVQTSAGQTLVFHTEAYVVKGMKVPLLLGEDFQTMYLLGVDRYKNGAHEVRVGCTGHRIPASASTQVDLNFVIRRAFRVQSFVRRKAALRAKKQYQREREADKSQVDMEKRCYVRAAHTYTLKPHSVHRIELRGDFEGRELWIVDKVVLEQSDGGVLSAPLTWVSSKNPYIPLANTTESPRLITEGEV
ncbi:hypothetical protein CYLTODRAFT_335515, partial [Cylindrobasidium torrendii FP15055 ss-10]